MISIFFLQFKSEKAEIKQDFDSNSELPPIKEYIENCLSTSSEKAVWDLSLSGGFKTSKNSINYDNRSVYIYNKIPKLEELEESFAKGILKNFDVCFDNSIIEKYGFNITSENKNINVKINDKNIIVELDIPISLEKNKKKTDFSSFLTTVEIKFGEIFKRASNLIQKSKTVEEPPYDIEEECELYDYNKLTNINIESKQGHQIVQFIDYSTLETSYGKSYEYIFALEKNLIKGDCVG